MKLELAEVLAELGIAEAHDLLAHRWDESEASYPDETPYFLQPARISEMRQYLDLSDEIEPHFLEAARIARDSTALSHLAWHFNRLLFLYDDYEGPKIGEWPELQQPLGELSDVFYMLIAISVVPITQATHRRLGVPEEITRHSTGNFNGLMFAYRNRHPGKLWGVNLSVLYWLRHYVSGALYTLGRMEYMVRPFQRPVQVYRNRDTDEVLALALDGLRYRPDGFLASEEAVAAGEPGFTSRLVETPDAVTGCPISPAGFALPLEVTLPLKTWRKVLSGRPAAGCAYPRRREHDPGKLPRHHGARAGVLPTLLPGAPLRRLRLRFMDTQPTAGRHLLADLEHDTVAAGAVPASDPYKRPLWPVLHLRQRRCRPDDCAARHQPAAGGVGSPGRRRAANQ
jgi:hypothetical protein